jgi:hypothetical protein
MDPRRTPGDTRSLAAAPPLRVVCLAVGLEGRRVLADEEHNSRENSVYARAVNPDSSI